MLFSNVKNNLDKKEFDKFLESFLDLELLSSRQINAIKLIFDSINDNYKILVLKSFESKCIFETRKLYFNVLLEKLQDSIIEIAEKQADNTSLESKTFISSYEAKVLKIYYFISQIIDLKDERVSSFTKLLLEIIKQ